MNETTTASLHERGRSERPPTPRLRARRHVIWIILTLLVPIFLLPISLFMELPTLFAFSVLFILHLVPTLVIVISIIHLRAKHADEVYLLWFTFFFMTYVIFGLYSYLSAEGSITDYFLDLDLLAAQHSQNRGILARLLSWYIDISVHPKDDILLLFSLLGLVVVPQFLSFVISGLFGCAKPPLIVSKVTWFAVFSLAKCFCILAAFETSTGLFALYRAYVNSKILETIDNSSLGVAPLFSLSFSFLLAAGYYRSADLLRVLIQTGTARTNRILDHMTRFTNG
jgi:hypothetical protein